MPALDDVSPRDRKAFYAGVITMAVGLALLYFSATAENTPLADPATGELASYSEAVSVDGENHQGIYKCW